MQLNKLLVFNRPNADRVFSLYLGELVHLVRTGEVEHGLQLVKRLGERDVVIVDNNASVYLYVLDLVKSAEGDILASVQASPSVDPETCGV